MKKVGGIRKLTAFALLACGVVVAGYAAGMLLRGAKQGLLNPQPVFWMDSTTLDLGDVFTHSPISTTAEIFNRGKKPLELKIVGTTCGCTGARLDKTVLAPGEGTRLEVEINPSTKKGGFGVSVHLSTNDPNQPDVSVGLSGNANNAVILTPAVVSFDDTEIDSRRDPVYLNIRTSGLLDAEVLENMGVEASVPYIGALLESSNGQTLLRAELINTAPIGALRSTITLTVPEVKLSIDIPVLARVFGRIDLEPETFYFGTVRPGQTVQSDVLLKNVSAADSIKSVDLDDALKDILDLTWTEGDGTVTFHAEFTAPEKRGRLEGSVYIRVENAAEKSDLDILIPVIAVISSQ